MARPVQALLKMPYMPAARFAGFGREVHAAMDGNAAFPAPTVLMATLASLSATLQTWVDAAVHGDTVAKARQQEARVALAAALRRLARYVNAVADGDAAIIASSGFPLAEVPVRHKDALMEQPMLEDLRVLRSGGGVALKVSAVKGAACYTALVCRAGAVDGARFGQTIIVEGAAAPAAIHSSRQRKMEITGLARATAYELRVFATGTSGVSPMSAAVPFVTQ